MGISCKKYIGSMQKLMKQAAKAGEDIKFRSAKQDEKAEKKKASSK